MTKNTKKQDILDLQYTDKEKIKMLRAIIAVLKEELPEATIESVLANTLRINI